MGLLRKSRAGEVHAGDVRRCTDPAIVKWPGHYGLRNGSVDPKCPVEWDAHTECWRRKA